jgi:hypothetical protein
VATNVDIEDLQTTRSEKLLAAVLTVFLLISGIWAYERLARERSYAPPAYTASERAAIAQSAAARERLFAAQRRVSRERSELELAREAYRTAIEAHRSSAALGARYRRETSQYNAAQAGVRRATADVRATGPAARAAFNRAAHEQLVREQRNDRNTFLLRLGFVLAALIVSFGAFIRLRRSRYLPLGFALVAAATIVALAMAVDYITDYVGWRDLGPLVLSAVGAGLTVLAFWGLQRYLLRRIPRRRVRRGECPFCGYPVRGAPHCEGCGRDVVAECAKCSAPRRVGTSFCGACGSV